MGTALIVNADDLGLHPRIDEGILRAHREGIVTSATVLVTGRSAAEAVARAREQGLPLGVHLCLSTRLTPALPVEQVRSLAPDGRFRASWAQLGFAWVAGRVRLSEVRAELAAQLNRCQALGFTPDHLDGHQHLHVLPGVSRIVSQLAAERNLPVRQPAESLRLSGLRHPFELAKAVGLSTLASRAGFTRQVPTVGLSDSGVLSEERLLAWLPRLSDGVYELGCHPGLAPDHVPEDPRWRYGWETELRALTSKRVREAIAERGIRLVSYAEAAV